MSIVQELRDYMANDPEFKLAFEDSFSQALAAGIHEFRENNINTLDDYIAWFETLLTWIPSERQDGQYIYHTVCLFYCVMNFQPLQSYTSPIDPSTCAPFTWLSEWVVRFAKEIGKFMDTPESITPEALETYYTAPLYHMQDYPVPPGGWQTFNEFFARHIDPTLRPIADPDSNMTITSPADAVFDGMWPMNDAAECVFDVKGLPWLIGALLDDEHSPDGIDYGATFAGGQFCHSFLGTYDYHRLHAPVSGKVLEARVIEGLCHLQVLLEEDHHGRVRVKPRRGIYGPSLSSPAGGASAGASGQEGKEDEDEGPCAELTAPDEPGYQFCQTRGLILIDAGDIGLVAVLPIGMACVSSVLMSVKEGDVVQKGDELAYFHLFTRASGRAKEDDIKRAGPRGGASGSRRHRSLARPGGAELKPAEAIYMHSYVRM